MVHEWEGKTFKDGDGNGRDHESRKYLKHHKVGIHIFCHQANHEQFYEVCS